MIFTKNFRAFTLIEVIIATSVLVLFLSGVYTLFTGGSKISGKSAWIQNTSSQIRLAEQRISKIIQSSSYPSTLTPTNVFDAGGDKQPSGNSPNFYIHLPQGIASITGNNISSKKVVFYSASCKPELIGFPQGNQPMTISWNVLSLQPQTDGTPYSSLLWEEKNATYNTTSPNYAKDLTATVNDAKIVNQSQILLRDVESIQFSLASPTANSYIPQKITAIIQCTYPKDPDKLKRRGESGGTPNVGIVIAP
ncbi:MAG: prepilin-type N-terminal cleavage/methylation domain-containing protein [Candidatus Riflebacteria bacterium]|nr:prepilin-type N-terminal cleavage/methylation domain-containing protein [Candidatus Riflebacteria bacterium]